MLSEIISCKCIDWRHADVLPGQRYGVAVEWWLAERNWDTKSEGTLIVCFFLTWYFNFLIEVIPMCCLNIKRCKHYMWNTWFIIWRRHVSTLYGVIVGPSFGIKSVNAVYMFGSQLCLMTWFQRRAWWWPYKGLKHVAPQTINVFDVYCFYLLIF
jgi:hypothetical protein